MYLILIDGNRMVNRKPPLLKSYLIFAYVHFICICSRDCRWDCDRNAYIICIISLIVLSNAFNHTRFKCYVQQRMTTTTTTTAAATTMIMIACCHQDFILLLCDCNSFDFVKNYSRFCRLLLWSELLLFSFSPSLFISFFLFQWFFSIFVRLCCFVFGCQFSFFDYTFY